jgi:hypothetical protein
MLERLKWPGLTMVLGCCGALLRRWQLGTAFEETLGLHQPGSLASWALAAFFVAAGLIFLLLALAEPESQNPTGQLSGWDYAFAAQRDLVFLAAMACAALLTLAAAPYLFQEASDLMALRNANGGEGENGLLQVILSVCSVPAAAALVFAGASAFRLRGRGRENLGLLLPVLLNCIWLLEGYRANAADPVLWHYTPLLIAIGLGLVFYLDCADLAFDKGHPRRLLWLAAMTAAASAVALASQPGAAMTVLLAAQTLSALAALWVIPANLRQSPAPECFRSQARQSGEPTPEEPEQTIEEAPENIQEAQEIQEEDTHV